ncbi:hypothetical protein HX021_05815 [Sphingobacterium sp. N143]|nr:hypothetical protein [Sphingobacterium sp. N143]
MFGSFENPKNPNRKQGKDYNVSELSQLAGDDFKYTNKLASRLYKLLKPIQERSCDRFTYTRLQKALYKAVRNDQSHDLGSLRLGYGDVSSLKGFRFSLKTSLGKFFVNNPASKFDKGKNSIEVRVPLDSLQKFENINSRLAKLVIKLYCIVIQINDRNDMEIHVSKNLELQRDHVRKDRTVSFSLGDRQDVVILCLCTIRCWLMEANEKDTFLSNDATLMATELVDAILIRDGELLTFSQEDSNDLLPPLRSNDGDEIDWD